MRIEDQMVENEKSNKFSVVEGDRAVSGPEKRSQWTVKGIDPEVVSLCREAARRSGMKMGSWVSMTLMKAATEGVPSWKPLDNDEVIGKRIEETQVQIVSEISDVNRACSTIIEEIERIQIALFKQMNDRALDDRSRVAG